jgi:hypothetical protein
MCKEEKAKERSKEYFVIEAVIANHHTIAHSNSQGFLKANIHENYHIS